jgi:hypothetical protein
LELGFIPGYKTAHPGKKFHTQVQNLPCETGVRCQTPEKNRCKKNFQLSAGSDDSNAVSAEPKARRQGFGVWQVLHRPHAQDQVSIF